MRILLFVTLTSIFVTIHGEAHPPAPPPAQKRAEIREKFNTVDELESIDDDHTSSNTEVDSVAAFEQIYNPDAVFTSPIISQATVDNAHTTIVAQVTTTTSGSVIITESMVESTPTAAATSITHQQVDETTQISINSSPLSTTTLIVTTEKPKTYEIRRENEKENRAAVINPKDPIIPNVPPRAVPLVPAVPTTQPPPMRVAPSVTLPFSPRVWNPNPHFKFPPLGSVSIDDLMEKPISTSKRVSTKHSHEAKEENNVQTVTQQLPPRLPETTTSILGILQERVTQPTGTLEGGFDYNGAFDYIDVTHPEHAKPVVNQVEHEVTLTADAEVPYIPVVDSSSPGDSEMGNEARAQIPIEAYAPEEEDKVTIHIPDEDDDNTSAITTVNSSASSSQTTSTTTTTTRTTSATTTATSTQGITIPFKSKATTKSMESIRPYGAVLNGYLDVSQTSDVLNKIPANQFAIPTSNEGKNTISVSRTYYEPTPVLRTVLRPVIVKSKSGRRAPRIEFRPYQYITYTSKRAVSNVQQVEVTDEQMKGTQFDFRFPFKKSLKQ